MISGLEDILKGSPEQVGGNTVAGGGGSGEAAVAAAAADGGGKAGVGKSDAAAGDAKENAATSGLYTCS